MRAHHRAKGEWRGRVDSQMFMASGIYSYRNDSIGSSREAFTAG
jgi:hypothetical protein